MDPEIASAFARLFTGAVFILSSNLAEIKLAIKGKGQSFGNFLAWLSGAGLMIWALFDLT